MIKNQKLFLNSKKYFILTLLFGFSLYFKFLWSNLSIWREDESVTLWLALVNNLFDSPFGNVSSTGLPNPNLAVVLSKFLIIFDSLSTVSFVIASIQMLIIYYAFYSKNYEYNKVLILFIGFSFYLTYLTSTIWYQFMITVLNALFLKIIFDYVFEKKHHLFYYFPLISILPASIYLGGLSNSVLFLVFFFFVIILKIKSFKSNFSNIKHFFISFTLFIFVIFITWYQYFTNFDFELLKIQSESRLFPYSRLRDYLFVGFQYIKETPQFFMDIFSSTDSIYFLFTNSGKLTDKTLKLIDFTFISHKVLNGISVLILFGSLILLFTNYKEKINFELVYKNIFVLTYVFFFTIMTPLLGGRQFLKFDIMALSVFASVYICFLFIWVSLPFIFKELKLINLFLKAFLYAFIFLNILTSFYLKNDYLNTQSLFISGADESPVYKQEIVEFIATKIENEVNIYYDLGGSYYNWIPEFNKKNYSTDYYLNAFSLGREFDYLFKKKYNIDNSQEGNVNRTFQDTDFYISYMFEEFPNNIYDKYKHYKFGNYRVTENLGKK